MKAIILIIFSALLIYSPQSYGFLAEEVQKEASPKDSSDLNLSKKINIKTNLGTAIFGIYSLSLDYKISPHIAITGAVLAGEFDQKSADKSLTFEIESKGANLMASYHLNEVYTNSFYASAMAGFLSIDVNLKDFSVPASISIDTPFIGGELGYIFYFKQFNFTLGAGGSKTFKDEEAELSVGGFNGTAKVQVHLNYHFNLSIGYVF